MRPVHDLPVPKGEWQGAGGCGTLAGVDSGTEMMVAETFVSIQGESTYAGLPCAFIRLAGCNLRCGYCDTPASQTGGTPRGIDALVREADTAGCPLIEVTGGEPLIQDGTVDLLSALTGLPGTTVLLETNGSCDIAGVPPEVVTILDMKSPGSGEWDPMDVDNLARLRAHDQVKCVLTDRADYEWARDLVREHRLAEKAAAVLFSPVSGALDPGALGAWIVEDRLPVRLQVQLHKVCGMA